MTSDNLLQKEIPLLQPNDLVSFAFTIMDDFKVEHLPVGNGDQYLGLVSEDDLLELDENTTVKDGSSKLIRCFMESSQHLVESFRYFSEFNVSLMPVLDKNNHYLGCILPSDIVKSFGKTISFSQEGGIVILKVHEKDFFMSQIAQIVEADDAKILSSWVKSHKKLGELEITLKINKSDLSGILQTFSRYDYTVLATYHESQHTSDIKERYEAFLKYLNM